jgi:hypothetical protein
MIWSKKVYTIDIFIISICRYEITNQKSIVEDERKQQSHMTNLKIYSSMTYKGINKKKLKGLNEEQQREPS